MAGTLDGRALALFAAIAVAFACVLALLGTSADRAPAAEKCPKADATPGEASSDQLGEAVLCLIGKERRKADLKKVESVGSLTRVAEKHTDVMIKKDCLDHRCKGEKSLNDRIVNSGYPIPGGRYGFGEVTGCSLTPQAMVDAWMENQGTGSACSATSTGMWASGPRRARPTCSTATTAGAVSTR